MKRKIIRIDEERCNGCGLCLPNCPEGALQIIDGKARLLGDRFCDGLGACLGHCPEGAIAFEEREAEPYDEKKVLDNMITRGPAVVKAHLEHLRDHNEEGLLKEALAYLKEKGMTLPSAEPARACGCPGAKAFDFGQHDKHGHVPSAPPQATPSALSHWPIQFHLISPSAPYFQKADVLLVADCVAYALGNFHQNYLKGNRLIIACPKLDCDQEVYLEKLVALIDEARINTLTVMTMEVSCCGALLNLARQAIGKAKRKVPLGSVVVGIRGEILSEEWLK